ncbi:CAP domain-containing protein [Geodermatophilus sp. SYSU D00697]
MPAGPPLSSRIVATLGRLLRTLGRALGLRRVVPLLAVAAAVAGVALTVPMVSGALTTTSDQVALDASSSSSGATAPRDPSSSGGAPRGATVQMGVDGAPAAAPGTASEAPVPGTTTPAPVEVPAPAPEAAAPTAPAEASTPPSSPTPVEEEVPAPARAEEPADEPAAARAEPAAAPRVAAAAPADPTAEGQVLALVNEARADAGCAPLVADGALAAVARAHSADMRDRDYFSHTTPEGLSPFDRADQAGVGHARAENIAYGQPDAAAVMEDWMNSSGHRANILDCELTTLGVGVAEGPGGPWWTQLFGA